MARITIVVSKISIFSRIMPQGLQLVGEPTQKKDVSYCLTSLVFYKDNIT